MVSPCSGTASPTDRSGLDDTIVEISCVRKCLSALVLIAPRYAASREHVLDVGGEGRIGVDLLLQLARGDAELDGEAKDVDQLLALMADEMRAEDKVRCAIDDDLRPRRGFGIG